jgi:hypothetical protein
MTVLLKVAVVELMVRGDCYCVTENPLALNIYIYIYDAQCDPQNTKNRM